MKRRLSLIAAVAAAPFALSACVVQDDTASKEAAEAANAAADSAADAADAADARDQVDINLDTPDIEVRDGDDRERTETTVRAGEDGVEITNTEERP